LRLPLRHPETSLMHSVCTTWCCFRCNRVTHLHSATSAVTHRRFRLLITHLCHRTVSKQNCRARIFHEQADRLFAHVEAGDGVLWWIQFSLPICPGARPTAERSAVQRSPKPRQHSDSAVDLQLPGMRPGVSTRSDAGGPAAKSGLLRICGSPHTPMICGRQEFSEMKESGQMLVRVALLDGERSPERLALYRSPAP
jgi:hypothetical protein